MRERILDAIYNKIEENPDDENMKKQLNLINKASICTIHSFCLDVIRNNFYELDISANFRVADSSEIELIKQEVVEDVFEEKYTNADEEFLKLVDAYTEYRDDEPLKELILKIYRYIQSAPFPEEWLNEKVNMFKYKSENFSNSVWGKILISDIEDNLNDYILRLENVKQKIMPYNELDKYTAVIQEDIEIITDIKNNLDNWDSVYERCNKIKFTTWPRDKKITNELKTYAKAARDGVKEGFGNIKNKNFIYTSEEIYSDINSMYETLTSLKNIILDFYNLSLSFFKLISVSFNLLKYHS